MRTRVFTYDGFANNDDYIRKCMAVHHAVMHRGFEFEGPWSEQNVTVKEKSIFQWRDSTRNAYANLFAYDSEADSMP